MLLMRDATHSLQILLLFVPRNRKCMTLWQANVYESLEGSALWKLERRNRRCEKLFLFSLPDVVQNVFKHSRVSVDKITQPPSLAHITTVFASQGQLKQIRVGKFVQTCHWSVISLTGDVQEHRLRGSERFHHRRISLAHHYIFGATVVGVGGRQRPAAAPADSGR